MQKTALFEEEHMDEQSDTIFNLFLQILTDSTFTQFFKRNQYIYKFIYNPLNSWCFLISRELHSTVKTSLPGLKI
jgi:hypothetical protein